MPGVWRLTLPFPAILSNKLHKMNQTQDDFEKRVADALANPENLGELEGADRVGTAGSEDCGDMLRMWIKFREDNGRKVIDRASFQTFGCQTALAVASVATRLLRGKTPEEALAMSGEELASPLGALPPMKIHCSQLVEGALKNALEEKSSPATGEKSIPSGAGTLLQNFTRPASGGTIKIQQPKNPS
jgi:nitrogen fixation NifU-like protein